MTPSYLYNVKEDVLQPRYALGYTHARQHIEGLGLDEWPTPSHHILIYHKSSRKKLRLPKAPRAEVSTCGVSHDIRGEISARLDLVRRSVLHTRGVM